MVVLASLDFPSLVLSRTGGDAGGNVLCVVRVSSQSKGVSVKAVVMTIKD
jgi:hypothetical protein